MVMRRRKAKQSEMMVPYHQVAESPGHLFYEKLNELLDEHRFDQRVEAMCIEHYSKRGRGSIAPGVYFRMLLIGYFEGIESERGICWRCADSLSLRHFLGYLTSESTPEHSSMTRIRQRLPIEIYERVFDIALELVASSGLLRGKVVGVDSTYLRADASMKTIVRRDTGEKYQEFLLRLAKESGIKDPTAEATGRLVVDAGIADAELLDRLVDNAWAESYEAREELTGYVQQYIAAHTAEEAYHAAQAYDLAWGAIRQPADTLTDAQFRARGNFVDLEHPGLGKLPYTTSPWLAEDLPWTVSHRAPRLGEHNQVVYGGELGLKDGTLQQLRAAKVI